MIMKDYVTSLNINYILINNFSNFRDKKRNKTKKVTTTTRNKKTKKKQKHAYFTLISHKLYHTNGQYIWKQYFHVQK